MASKDGSEKQVGEVSLYGTMFYIMDGRLAGEFPSHSPLATALYYRGPERLRQLAREMTNDESNQEGDRETSSEGRVLDPFDHRLLKHVRAVSEGSVERARCIFVHTAEGGDKGATRPRL